jgi:hypothetical protein
MAALLDLVRKLIDYGKELAGNLHQRVAENPYFAVFNYATNTSRWSWHGSPAACCAPPHSKKDWPASPPDPAGSPSTPGPRSNGSNGSNASHAPAQPDGW